MRRSTRLLTFLLVAGLTAIPASGYGAIHVVTDFGDTGAPGQLRTLIDAAVDGDTIMIPAGTIVLTGAAYEGANASGDLDIHKSLSFQGAGAGVTVIDGGGVDRVFELFPGTVGIIQNLTVRNGSIPVLLPFSAAGGCIRLDGSLKLLDAVVESCYGFGGGAIFNTGNLAIERSTIRNSISDGITANGGGIANFGNLLIFDSTISGNQVVGISGSTQGGGVHTIGPMTIENSTISGNTATGTQGGGIYAFNSAVNLNNVTIANNVIDVDGSGAVGGGGLANGGGAAVVNMSNTILADNRVGRGRGRPGRDDCSGDITSLGHNLIQDYTCVLLGATPSDLLGANAKLFPLRDNGGPTHTHAIKHNSAAADAGDNLLCPPFDQRGEIRPLDGDRDGVAVCDIGAYEYRR